jgi:hypothetical protein
MRLNAKRGLFRLWLVGSLIWLAATVFIRSPVQPFAELWWATRPLPPGCEAVVASFQRPTPAASPAEAPARPVDPVGSMRALREVTAAMAEADKCPVYLSGDFDRYTAGWTPLRKETMTAWLAGVDPRKDALASLGGFAFLALMPSLAVLALGAALFWAIGSFRPEAGQTIKDQR